MAQHIIRGTSSLSNSASRSPSLNLVVTLRMTLGLVATLGSLISFLGTSWDIQWHVFVGRDRTLIPPHEMMLTGITVSGIAALAVVVIETIWARQGRGLTKHVTTFAGLFSGPLGAYIIGFAALNGALAFPLDSYWHTLYGIDVTLWAPFHVMIISGMALIGFGAIYTFASVTNLAASINATRTRLAAHIGMIVAFATTLSLFTLLTFNALDTDYLLNLGVASLCLFPALVGLLYGSLLRAAAFTIPRKWVATSVVGVSFLFVLIDQLAIPPALNWLMQIEQLTFRNVQHPNPPQIAIVAVEWPLLILVSAVLFDLCVQRARKHNWSKRNLTIALALATFVGCIPLNIKNPTLAWDLVISLGVPGALLSIAVGFLGIYIGTKLGQNITETTSTLEG